MARFSALVLAALLVAFLLVATPQVEGAVSCGTVASSISPCINYLTKNGPLGGCCAGVRRLAGSAMTTADRRTACGCLKSLSANLKGLDARKASSLPRTCGVNVPYPISPSTDCSRVA